MQQIKQAENYEIRCCTTSSLYDSQLRNVNTRDYIKVSNQQRDIFIQLMQLPDRMTVREAAQRAGMKYARATAVYREMRAERAQIMQMIPVRSVVPVTSSQVNCPSEPQQSSQNGASQSQQQATMAITSQEEPSGEQNQACKHSNGAFSDKQRCSTEKTENSNNSIKWFDEKANILCMLVKGQNVPEPEPEQSMFLSRLRKYKEKQRKINRTAAPPNDALTASYIDFVKVLNSLNLTANSSQLSSSITAPY